MNIFGIEFGSKTTKPLQELEEVNSEESGHNPNQTLVLKDKDDRPMDEQQITGFVKKKFDKMRSNREATELQWRLDIDHYLGNQFNQIDPTQKSIVEQKKSVWWESREVFNHIQPIINARISKLKKAKSTSKTRPESGSAQDISKAKITNSVLASLEHSEEVTGIWDEAISWSELTGSAIFGIEWDAEKGRVLVNFEDGGKLKEGDLLTTCISPFEIFVEDLHCSSVNKQRAMIRAQVMDVDDIFDIFGIEVTPETVSGFGIALSDVSKGGASGYSRNTTLKPQELENSAIVFTYTELPSNRYPEGKRIICTKDKLLACTELPYINMDDGNRSHPYVIQKAINIPSQFFGKTVIELLIPVQRAYNNVRNRKLDFIYQLVYGVYQVDESSIPDWQLEDIKQNGISPNDVIVRRAGSEGLKVLEVPIYPASLENEEEKLKHEMIELSGVSEISRTSTAPTGVNSGIALQILEEQDNTRLSLTADNYNQAKVSVCRQWINLFRQFVQVERIARVGNNTSRVDIVKWKGEDLTSADIFIESSSLLSDTLSQRRQMVFDLLQRGFFNDGKTGAITAAGKAKLFEILELGNWESFDDDNITRDHIERANRENYNITNGLGAAIKDIDDHLLHIMSHNKYRLSESFEELEAKDPETAMRLQAHIDEHVNKVSEIAASHMLEQQAQQTLSEGSPDQAA